MNSLNIVVCKTRTEEEGEEYPDDEPEEDEDPCLEIKVNPLGGDT